VGIGNQYLKVLKRSLLSAQIKFAKHARSLSKIESVEESMDELALNGFNYPSYNYYKSEAPCKHVQECPRDFLDFVIIIQGPIPTEPEILLNTIKIYLSYYPGVTIILSTWQGEYIQPIFDYIDGLTFKNRNTVKIILNEKPLNPGIGNINLQVVSTRKALEYALSIEKVFALKTRTDQVILNPSALVIMHQEYEHASKTGRGVDRILIGSRNTFLFRPYSYSDTLQFAKIDLLLDFWGVELDTRKPDQIDLNSTSTPMQWAEQNLCEVYLVREFLIKKNFIPVLNFKTHLQALAEFFVVVDSGQIGVYWNKYTYHQNPWLRLGRWYSTYEVSAFDWKMLNSNIAIYLNLEAYCFEKWE